MINFSTTIHIERPQQEIFDFMADPTNDTEWRDSAVSSEWVGEGPAGVGSKLKSVDRLLGRKIESTSEVTVWDPPRQYGQKSIGGPVPFALTVTLDPAGSGTQVTIEGQAEIGGFFKLAEGLAGKQLKKQIETDFAGLKRVLEAGQA
jgi:carbon monoxide dehydrogenase subunit G